MHGWMGVMPSLNKFVSSLSSHAAVTLPSSNSALHVCSHKSYFYYGKGNVSLPHASPTLNSTFACYVLYKKSFLTIEETSMQHVNWRRTYYILGSTVFLGIILWATWSILGYFGLAVILLLLSMAVA